MTRTIVIFILFLFHAQANCQSNSIDSIKQEYQTALKLTGKKFSADFYPNYARMYSLPEKLFIKKIDSARLRFNTILDHYKKHLDKNYRQRQQLEIEYYFDRLLVDYPTNHEIYTGASRDKYKIPKRLISNLKDFNKPELLDNSDFTDYVRSLLSYQAGIELKKYSYKGTDNQRLHATWKLIPEYFTNATCKAFWKYHYLYDHIENNGIKNITGIYNDFMANCKDTSYSKQIRQIYEQDYAGRQGHLVKRYKSIDSLTLDIHMFLPKEDTTQRKRPTIVFFHGGSWSEGKPDWFFDACADYAQKGWVACAVEYRTYGRHGTLPFDAVMDARSAIRWLRQHSDEYGIDNDKIIASGNSAGGHLALCTALADKWNDKNDNMEFSSIPNALMINSGVYDLTDINTSWIRKDLQNKDLVKEISPIHLIKKGVPPTLIIHGTEDGNVPYASAKKFVDEMAKAGNTSIKFHPITGAGHFIWFDPKYVPEVSRIRNDFLSHYN